MVPYAAWPVAPSISMVTSSVTGSIFLQWTVHQHSQDASDWELNAGYWRRLRSTAPNPSAGLAVYADRYLDSRYVNAHCLSALRAQTHKSEMGQITMSNMDQIVADVLEMKVEDVSDDISPTSATNWDSMRHIELVLALESNFGVKFSTSEIVLINSVGSARDLLRRKGAGV